MKKNQKSGQASGCPGQRAAGRRACLPASSGRKNVKKGTTGKLLLASVTFFNLLLSLLLAVLNRQEVIKAVQREEKVQVLLSSVKETKASE